MNSTLEVSVRLGNIVEIASNVCSFQKSQVVILNVINQKMLQKGGGGKGGVAHFFPPLTAAYTPSWRHELRQREMLG